MAIPKELEPLLEGFTAEEKTQFDNLITKQAASAKAKDPNAPTLAEGWLRQADYDRRMNLNKEEVTKAQERTKQLEDWYTENEPIHRAALDRARELESAKTELEKQLEEARQKRAAEGGDQVDAAELAKRVQDEVGRLREQYGFVSKEDQQKIIQDEVAKLAHEETKKAIDDATKAYYEVAMPQGVNLAADIAEICVDHKAEFGERLDRKKFAEFMTERKLIDPVKAYDEYVKPRRDEVEFKKRVEEEVKQRVSGMSLAGGAVPTGGPMEKGAVQQKIEKDAAAQGNNLSVLAAQAAQELRQEGKM